MRNRIHYPKNAYRISTEQSLLDEIVDKTELLKLIRLDKTMTENTESVSSELVTKAAASLQEQIDKELLEPDPTPDKAKGILNKDKESE